MPETVVLLHGFAGTRHGWDRVVYRLDRELYEPLAPDLRGHGEAAGRRPITFGTLTEDVLAAAPDRFALCGYSMGGRIALHVALAAPERVSRLVLVSTTAGLEDAAEREARRRADDELADATEGGTIGAFADRWCEQPLFADDPPLVSGRAREDIARNDPAGLAASLRGVGTGVMEPLWDRLGGLTMPATVLAGARDEKFCAIARRLADALPAATLHLVPGAGHALPREAPAAIAEAIAP
jgi:2-succinyl-6-hydroxy-2,4-cyclohexadiene-1-carboxylate synthase